VKWKVNKNEVEHSPGVHISGKYGTENWQIGQALELSY
jgi:hypothetical protein